MHYTDKRNKLLPTANNDRRTFFSPLSVLTAQDDDAGSGWPGGDDAGGRCKILDWAAVVERRENYLQE